MQSLSGRSVLSIEQSVQETGCGQEAGRIEHHQEQVQHQLGRFEEIKKNRLYGVCVYEVRNKIIGWNISQKLFLFR